MSTHRLYLLPDLPDSSKLASMKPLRLTLFTSLLTCAAFVFPPAAEACRAPSPSPQAVVSGAEVIVRATALKYVRAPEGPIRHLNEPPDTEIEFRIEEVLKGKDVPPAIILNGYLIDRNDHNDRPVPYDLVRRGGRGGSCSAYEYKQGGEFLLFLRKVDGTLTIRWYPLAPTNEQIKSTDDPWVKWVKRQLSEN